MIKNIIFDFGDIFINLDKSATNKAFNKLGIYTVTEDLMLLFKAYEKGEVSTEDFILFFTSKYTLQKEEIVTAWNAILLDFPLHRLVFLKTLFESKKYKLFLLSNTNDLHITSIKNSWGEALYADFKNCFEQFYLSHEIHLRKPDTSIFEFVLKENKLLPEETVFIDDVSENTKAAGKLGIQTWNLIPGKEDITQLLTKIN